MITTDCLVIGSGIAGLTYALKVARKFPEKKIIILTKADEDESNTKYAQGGVAVVSDFENDSYEKHIADTLDAGAGLCNPHIVRMVVEEGPARIKEIIEWGTDFDKSDSGQFDLGKEGGHSENRVLHHKDITGFEIEKTLLQQVHRQPNIEIYDHHFVVDIITQHHLGRIVTRATDNITCFGVYTINLDTRQIEKIMAKITLLATGGAGQVYRNTTNPKIATGDGVAMVYRAKGKLENMEFIQFHPTALYQPGISPSFLISEAVRGFGAILKSADGKEFMHTYDKRKSLAPRDIVARAIDNEMKISGEECVFLDARHLEADRFYDHFPNITDKCKSIGVDPSKDLIPVVPAAHYLCGGVKVNENGQTSIDNLFACGECASTGLHGANRLASNSLLEALVIAHRSYLASSEALEKVRTTEQVPDWNAEGTTDPNEMVLITQSRKELQEVMSSYVGIVRSDVRLKRANDRLLLLYRETEELYEKTTISPQLCELRNMITVGYIITRSSALRKESRGLHFTTDHTGQYAFLENTVL